MIRLSALGALNGEEKWEKQVDALMEAVDKSVPQPARELDKPFLMPIEDIFSIQGRGTVVTGRIERGKVKVGEEAEIVGFRETRKTVVTGVEMFKKQLDEGMAGDNAGLLLRGIAKEDVERGMVLAKGGSITPHTKFKAEVYILTKEEGGRHTPFFKGYRPQFYLRTTDVTGSRSCRRHGDGDAGRQREPGDRADHAGGNGEGLAVRDPRRRPHSRRRDHFGDCDVVSVEPGLHPAETSQRPVPTQAKDWSVMPREIITLQCGECKERNYSTTKNRKTTPDRIESRSSVPVAASTSRIKKLSRLERGSEEVTPCATSGA